MSAENLKKIFESLKSERQIETQEQFAMKLGVSTERMKNLLLGRVKLKREEAERVSNIYQVNPQWLLTGKGLRMLPVTVEVPIDNIQKAINVSTTKAKAFDWLSVEKQNLLTQLLFAVEVSDGRRVDNMLTNLSHDMVYVPRYDIKASAGGGTLIHDESIVDHLAFKRDWLINTLECKPDAVCVIQVRGDSMTPTFNDSDLLLLDIRTTDCFSEGVYVIQLKGALLVKRLRFKISGAVDVISDNVKYGVESLTADEVDRLTIIGRVVWHGSKF